MRMLAALLVVLLLNTAILADEPVRAVGIGRARPGLQGPQARLMAERAAQLDAARQLLAKTNPASVQYFPESKRRVIQGTLRGQHYRPAYFSPDGTARVVAEIPNKGTP